MRYINNKVMLCYVFMAPQSFNTPFSAVYLSVAGLRAALYYVNENVGKPGGDMRGLL